MWQNTIVPLPNGSRVIKVKKERERERMKDEEPAEEADLSDNEWIEIQGILQTKNS